MDQNLKLMDQVLKFVTRRTRTDGPEIGKLGPQIQTLGP
jgi:hypothetical protein